MQSQSRDLTIQWESLLAVVSNHLVISRPHCEGFFRLAGTKARESPELLDSEGEERHPAGEFTTQG